MRERHRRVVEQQESIDLHEPKAERLEDERDEERSQGIATHRRGTTAAPSDKPENEPPHPQDVNEIGEESC